jgi:F420-0:gamma-glutamyl ligase-like protein
VKSNAIQMTKYKVLSVATEFWKPGHDYLKEIVDHIDGKIIDHDTVVISEKALSTARNNIVDESHVDPGLSARFIAAHWMPIAWGYLLGPLCHLKEKLLNQIRHYPSEMGSRHKQVALQRAGLLQALMFGSEGAIDGSNLPFAFVSLSLNDADAIAETIRREIHNLLKKKVAVMIVDTDKTYSFRNFHFTPRPKPMKGIYSCGGVVAYVAGRFLKLKKRATPLALKGCNLTVGETLNVAELANRARGFGAGTTVWNMAERFKVDLSGVTWEMLARVKHKPIVIVRTSG